MESPERNESIPSPVDQGSPFFKYLCGLSPIKPARSVHVVQTYAELSLPPPPAVFTSPNPNKSGGRAKRGLVVRRTASTHVTVEAVDILGSAWRVDKENQPQHGYIPKSCAAAQADIGHPSSHVSSEYSQHHFVRHKVQLQQLTDVTGDTPVSSEYGDVADYLADPPEGGLYTSASSSQLVAKSYTQGASPDSEDYGCPEDDDHYHVEVVNKESLLSEHQDHAIFCDDATNVSLRDLATTQPIPAVRSHHQLSDFRSKDRRESLVSRANGSCSGHDGSGNSGAEKSSHVEQEAAAMAFLLVGDGDGEGCTRNDWAATQSALSELSRHQTPDFSTVGRISNLAQLRTKEDFELAASRALANQRNLSADVRDRELDDKKDVLAGGTLGQRGVRRRCLDFETSVRRKSMGGVGSRKYSAPRAKALPGSSAMTPATTIPSSVLSERAAATSDATNSAAATVDVHEDTSLRPECASFGSKGLSPGILRVSRCSVKRSADLMSTDKCPIEPYRAVRDSCNTSSSVGVPSGIGLHLNSLTGSISFSPTEREFKQKTGIASATKGAVASLLGMPGLAGNTQDHLSEDFGTTALGVGAGSKTFSMGSTTSSFGSGVVISVMERSRVTLREALPVADISRGLLNPNALQSLTVGGRQSLEGSRASRANVLDKKFGSGGKKRFLHQDGLQQSNFDFADEYDSPRSPPKKRKSPSTSGERSGEGCKRCNCKKSKCLKLYCECFTAGTYCVGSCTCHDCFNKPEHEETVLSTRQQIELRNPLAFAPKIIHSGDVSPKQGREVIIETPASARHKRGCNCKKSLCLKKYCECYQAGVGCSEGCRCEGCKNMFGRKEAIEDTGDKEIMSEALDNGTPENEVDLSRPGFHGSVRNTDQHCHHGKDLSPITPSFQYTGQGRTVGRVRSAGKKRSSSPLSQSQPTPKLLQLPVSATCSATNFQSQNNAQQNPDLPHLRGGKSPISTPKLSRVNQLSPRWDGLGDICTLTPLPHPPLRPTPASISTLGRSGASPSFSLQSIEPISSFQPDKLDSVLKSSPPPFEQPSDHSPLPSFGACSSQNPDNRPTPCTPCLSLPFLGKDNLKAGDAQSGHLPAFLCDDDGTPDFLKYPDSNNSPVVTKSSSPKQKRVSPPHFEGMRGRNSGDGRVVFDSSARSSPGLRSGRKFILQAVPCLPPLMPLTNSPQGQAGNCPKQV